jgi:hypothetical protein
MRHLRNLTIHIRGIYCRCCTTRGNEIPRFSPGEPVPTYRRGPRWGASGPTAPIGRILGSNGGGVQWWGSMVGLNGGAQWWGPMVGSGDGGGGGGVRRSRLENRASGPFWLGDDARDASRVGSEARALVLLVACAPAPVRVEAKPRDTRASRATRWLLIFSLSLSPSLSVTVSRMRWRNSRPRQRASLVICVRPVPR